jgi:hypothetical protein
MCHQSRWRTCYGIEDSYQGIASAMPSMTRNPNGFSRWPYLHATAAEAGLIFKPVAACLKACPDTNLFVSVTGSESEKAIQKELAVAFRAEDG